MLEDPRYLKFLAPGNLRLISPGNIWQPGIPLVDSIEKGREGNQEGSDQHKGEEGVISVNHLFGTNACSIRIIGNLNISPDNGQTVVKAEEDS